MTEEEREDTESEEGTEACLEEVGTVEWDCLVLPLSAQTLAMTMLCLALPLSSRTLVMMMLEMAPSQLMTQMTLGRSARKVNSRAPMDNASYPITCVTSTTHPIVLMEAMK